MANVLVNGWRAIVTGALRVIQTEPKYIGVGTGAGTAAATDTTLFSEKAADLSATSGTRITGTSSQVTTTTTNDTYQLVGTLTMTGAGPTSVTNVGQFDNSTIGSGNLFSKADFAGIPLSLNDQITFTLKSQIN
jgi:hypothetical protein